MKASFRMICLTVLVGCGMLTAGLKRGTSKMDVTCPSISTQNFLRLHAYGQRLLLWAAELSRTFHMPTLHHVHWEKRHVAAGMPSRIAARQPGYTCQANCVSKSTTNLFKMWKS